MTSSEPSSDTNEFLESVDFDKAAIIDSFLSAPPLYFKMNQHLNPNLPQTPITTSFQSQPQPTFVRTNPNSQPSFLSMYPQFPIYEYHDPTNSSIPTLDFVQATSNHSVSPMNPFPSLTLIRTMEPDLNIPLQSPFQEPKISLHHSCYGIAH